MATKLWLRGETKKNEHRSALTPSVCKKLLENGFQITVERCPERFFADSEFEAVGCTLVEKGTWRTAPKDYVIVGLKELPENDDSPLEHRHVFFAHCYKQQAGWREILNRFAVGKGELLDLEFLNDEKGRRVAAFGYYAGYAGAAVGLDLWAHNALTSRATYPTITSVKDDETLIANIKSRIAAVHQSRGNTELPRCIVMGALGRCGTGAVACLRAAGIPADHIVEWDMKETAKGGPFPEILENDIFINCIYLSSPIPPFVDHELLARGGKLSIIVDVSCDATNPHNPIPIYNHTTTFDEPVIVAKIGERVYDIVAIDHLPTLLPRESSDRFATDLLPSFLELANFDNARVWQDALALFRTKLAAAQQQ